MATAPQADVGSTATNLATGIVKVGTEKLVTRSRKKHKASTEQNTVTDDAKRESNPIVFSISQWANNNAAKVQEAHSLKGGWEGWAQVELAMAFRKDHGFNYKSSNDQLFLSREDPVYKNTNQRADHMFLNHRGTDIIELKCESWHNWDNFAENLVKDLKKVKEGEIDSKFKPSTVWVIGITVSDEAAKAVKQKCPALKMLNGQVQKKICVWWWSKTV